MESEGEIMMQVQLINEEFSRLASSNERPEVERPNMDAGGPVHNGEVATDESCFVETARLRVCPREGQYGIQVPLGAWHSVVVHEPSTILEAKDGACFWYRS